VNHKAILKHVRIVLAAVVVLAGLAVTSANLLAREISARVQPAVASAGNLNPGVIPPKGAPYGMTYGEWSARWWQWAIGLPSDHNPLTDTADCSAGQLGPVWFLGGAFYPASSTDFRHCNVPAGKALFIPIIDTECSNLEPPPWFGATEEERRACAKVNMDPPAVEPANLFAEVDGVPVQNLTAYRVVSPNFYFTAPDLNVLGVPGGSGESVGDGYFLLLAPLSAGPHTIHFGGIFTDWSLDLTYYINVKK
jgi:hypothetical protein